MKSKATDSSRMSRRALLGAAGGLVAGGLIRTEAHAVKVPAQASGRTLGAPTSALGKRAPGEQPRRRLGQPAAAGSSQTPIHELDGIITPSDLHFERHHGGIPAIVGEDYSLLIHGMVERPMKFSLADLKRFPSVSRISFIECSGNGGRAYRTGDVPTEMSPQTIDGLFSTSEWTGVSVATLLREVGVGPGASWLLAEGGDSVAMTRSIPLEKALDDAMIAYGQNGEAIRPAQGYPARVMLPGWEGNAQVKWVKRIEVGDAPFMTRDETSRYTDPLADGTARIFSFVMDAKSTITFPAYPYVLPERGWWEVKGLAWSGRGLIERVEISTDGGRTWAPAELQGPVLSKCATRFRYLWDWDGGEAMLMSRAIDETGYVQPTVQALIDARGAGSAYHSNGIRPWKVERGGRVVFGLADTL